MKIKSKSGKEVKSILINHLGFEITVDNTLEMTKGNDIQYLNHNSLCILLCVLPTSAQHNHVQYPKQKLIKTNNPLP